MASTSTRRRPAFLAALAAALIVLPAGTAPGASGPGQAGTIALKVQTQNLYLGADLTPALQATDSAQFFAAADAIWSGVKATDFTTRAQRIADEIAAADPDVVALQEVSRWTATGGGEPSFDYLAVILGALGERGLGYFVGAISNNADIGPMPLPSAEDPRFQLRFQDRDVILVRNRAGLTFDNPQHAIFEAQASIRTPAGPVSMRRGWASIDGAVGDHAFRFVDTHLESAAEPAVQAAQAQELVSAPMGGPGPVIAAGDFGSAADGTTTPTYSLLTQTFSDAWSARHPNQPGFTCCQAPDLLNAQSLLSQRTDLVLTRGTLGQTAPKTTLVGDSQADLIALGRWPSDHAGVVAKVYP
jgi:endonuclease/exonuclease/phosphatase family metal-dependent hydrolase